MWLFVDIFEVHWMYLLVVTDSEADEETVDPATLNAWDTATLENIHDLTVKGIR